LGGEKKKGRGGGDRGGKVNKVKHRDPPTHSLQHTHTKGAMGNTVVMILETNIFKKLQMFSMVTMNPLLAWFLLALHSNC